MTLWGTFVPVGMAVGAAAYAYAAGLSDWRWAQGLSVLAGGALAACLLRMQPRETHAAAPVDAKTRQRTGATLWALVAAFGAYVISEVGQLALMPSLLKEAGMSLSAAGSWTALAALANVPAGVIAARLMRHEAFVGRAMVLCLLATGALFPLVYQLGAPPLQLALMAIAVNLVSGVFASLVFALLPGVAGSPERLSLASGRLTQFGASGALLGPPLIGSVVEHWSWQSAGWASLGLSLVAAGLAWRAVAHGAAGSTAKARAT